MAEKMTLDELIDEIDMVGVDYISRGQGYETDSDLGAFMHGMKEACKIIHDNRPALEAALTPTGERTAALTLVEAQGRIAELERQLQAHETPEPTGDVTTLMACPTCGKSIDTGWMCCPWCGPPPTGDVGSLLDRMQEQVSHFPNDNKCNFTCNILYTLLRQLRAAVGAIQRELDRAWDERRGFLHQVLELAKLDGYETPCNLKAYGYLKYLIGTQLPELVKQRDKLQRERDEYAEETIRLEGEIRDRTVIVNPNVELQRERDEAVGLLGELVGERDTIDIATTDEGGADYSCRCRFCHTRYVDELKFCQNPACPAVRARAMRDVPPDEEAPKC